MNRMARHSISLASILIGCSACFSGETIEQGPEDNEVIHFERTTTGGTEPYVVPISLCQLVSWREAGGGVYDVTGLANDPQQAPFRTFASLSLVTPWSSSAPTHPVVEIRGGEGPGNSFLNHTVDLAVGERVGILLRPTSSQYFITGEHSVFRDRGNGVSNGFVFRRGNKTMTEVGADISSLYAGLEKDGKCPFDIPPDTPLPAVTTPAGDGSDVSHEGYFVSETE